MSSPSRMSLDFQHRLLHGSPQSEMKRRRTEALRGRGPAVTGRHLNFGPPPAFNPVAAVEASQAASRAAEARNAKSALHRTAANNAANIAAGRGLNSLGANGENSSPANSNSQNNSPTGRSRTPERTAVSIISGDSRERSGGKGLSFLRSSGLAKSPVEKPSLLLALEAPRTVHGQIHSLQSGKPLGHRLQNVSGKLIGQLIEIEFP